MACLPDQLLGLDVLCRHLVQLGLEASLVKGGGAIALAGRAASSVELRVGGTLWGLDGFGGHSTVRFGPVPLYASRTFPLQSVWSTAVDPSGRAERFDATLKTSRSGFLWLGEVTAAHWVGGALAERLNAQPERTLELARELAPRESLRVRANPDRRRVQLVHQSKLVARLSLLSSEPLEVQRRLPSATLVEGLERVAKTVRAVARSKNRRPS